MRKLFNLLILVILLAMPASGFSQVKDKSEYDINCSIPNEFRKLSPHPLGIPTEVKIGVFFVDIKAITDVKQTFSCHAILRFSWNDPRLSEKSLGRSLEYCDIARDEIWHPDLVAVNLAEADIYKETLDIDKNGNVEYTRRARNAKFNIDLVFTEFPFDTQVLHLVLATADEITFVHDSEFTGMRKALSIEGWDIELKEPIVLSEHLDSQDNIARMDFRLEAKRHPGFILWKVLLPLCLIVLMAWCVFWIDPSQIGPQIGLSTATVFTLIAFRFSLGFLLPPISYFTPLDTFVFLSTMLVFIALGLAIATSRLASKGKKDLAVKIERASRILYLILFAVVIIFSFVV